MSQLVSQIVNRWFPQSSDQLSVGSFATSRVVEKFGSPVFLYSAEVFRKKFLILKDTFPEKFSIYYSVKANPNPAIIERFIKLGCGLEVASRGEFYLGLKSGGTPQQILFAGPGKTEEEIEYVIKNDIGEIHAESLIEVGRINAIGQRLGTIVPISIRINPTAEVQGGAMRMGGKAVQFGIDEERLDDVLDEMRSFASVRLQGLHLFAGTQILDARILLEQYKKGIELARRFSEKVDAPIRTLDFGGGFGIPYFDHEKDLNFSELKRGLEALMDSIKTESCFSETKFIVEPGRFLVGESGIYLSRIVDIKQSRGKTFVILDGGMNHHLAASGNLGQVIKRNFPMALVDKLNQDATEVYDIVGPLCTPLDTLGRDVKLPKAEVGDVLGVFQSGAYARSASPLYFLSHTSPPEVMLNENAAFLIRKARTYDHMFDDIVYESVKL